MPSTVPPNRARKSNSISTLLLVWLGGVLFGAAFLHDALAPLAWIAFVPLQIALERERDAGRGPGAGFRLGWNFGLAAYLVGAHWLIRLSDVAITVPWLKYPAWLLVAVYLALYLGAACALALGLARRTGASLAVLFPAAVLVSESVRASGELGFPWFQPGYTQHALIPILQLASLGGVGLVTLWVLLVNVLVWRALRPPAGARRGLALAGAGFAILLPWLWGTRTLQAAPRIRPDAPVVALIQGNVTGDIKWGGKHQKEILDTFVRLSEAGAQPSRPILIVWPETATGSYLWRQVDQALTVANLAARTGAPVLSGFPDYHFTSGGVTVWENSAGMFQPDGKLGLRYAKIHLVPFGERMPFQRWIPALGKVALGQAEWLPGHEHVQFASAAGPFGCLICFEAIYPELARSAVRSGARWLVNITNDEWFGNSAALGQHAAMSVFRAVEHHVPLARCANTGVTMMVDANGRVTAQVPVWSPQVLRAPLPDPGIPTPYTKIGDWPAWVALAALAIAPLVAARTRAAAAR